MNIEALLHEIEALTPQKQEEVADFIAFLRARAGAENQESSAAAPRVKPDGFFGIWADRGAMRDSTAWVHNLREREWHTADG